MHEGGRRLFSEDDYSSGIVALSKEIVAPTMHEGGRRLFSEDDYSSGIVALSKEIVADNAACRVRVRTLSGVVYECRWCQSCEYSLVRDENSGYWIGWKKGEHSEAQHRENTVKPNTGPKHCASMSASRLHME